MGYPLTNYKYIKSFKGVSSSRIYDDIDDMSSYEIEDVGTGFVRGTNPRFHPFDILKPEEVNVIVEVILDYSEKPIEEYVKELPEVQKTCIFCRLGEESRKIFERK